ncbi:MAG: hypothetical protein WC708_01165 [Lentisphaeria bacterium]|jgi:hypothetical protein
MIEPKIRNTHIQPSGDGQRASLVTEVVVDGVLCQQIVIASGPIHDVTDLFEGRITMQELRERWKPKGRRQSQFRTTPATTNHDE